MSIQEQILRAREIVNTLEGNDVDKIEILENETDIFELMDWILKKDLEFNKEGEAMSEIANVYLKRAKSRKNAQEGIRSLLHVIMKSGELKTYKSSLGTVYIKKLGDKVTIKNVDLLPDDCYELIKKPINTEVKKLGEHEALDIIKNRESLSIRRV